MNYPGAMEPHKHDEASQGKAVPRIATDAWLSVVQAYNRCEATLAARAAERGYTLLQHEILLNLLYHPGATQQEIANRCFSAKSGISVLISDFEARGMLTKQRDQTDGRIWRLTLTEAGYAAARAAQEDQKEVIAAMTSAYPLKDLAVLKERMDHISQILDEMRRTPRR